MKILAINGSHRGKNGFTQLVLETIFNGARRAGADCETVNLADIRIHPCIACNACHTENNYLKCVYEDTDDVNTVFEKMKGVDLIIYATPIYIFAMSGLMKTFLERINSTGDSSRMTISNAGLFFHHIDRAVFSKPFALLTCCDNMEDETPRNTIEYFKTFGRFMDAKQVGCIVRKSGKLMGHGKNPDKEKEFPIITDIYRALEEAGRELAIQGQISPLTQKRANKDIVAIPPIVRLLMRVKPLKVKIFYAVIQKRMNGRMG